MITSEEGKEDAREHCPENDRYAPKVFGKRDFPRRVDWENRGRNRRVGRKDISRPTLSSELYPTLLFSDWMDE